MFFYYENSVVLPEWLTSHSLTTVQRCAQALDLKMIPENHCAVAYQRQQGRSQNHMQEYFEFVCPTIMPPDCFLPADSVAAALLCCPCFFTCYAVAAIVFFVMSMFCQDDGRRPTAVRCTRLIVFVIGKKHKKVHARGHCRILFLWSL